MRHNLLILALALSGCGWFIPSWPHLPDKGTCRYFKMTTWGETVAPWNEVAWGQEVVWIDEPMLVQWGWKGDLSKPEDVCGEIGIQMVKERIAQKRIESPGAKVWLNWSTEEWIAVTTFCNEPPGLSADIVSMDSYGGIWDWEIHMRWRLDQMLRLLAPGQMMGLVPEGHYYPAAGITWSPIDYVMINTLYFDWAFRRQDSGRIYAMAPFLYGPCKGRWGEEDVFCIGDPEQVQLHTLLVNLQQEYPLCQE